MHDSKFEIKHKNKEKVENPNSCDRDIQNLIGQLLLTSVIRSRRLQRAGHVVREPKKRGIYKALCERAMGRRPQGRPKMRWIDNVRQGATSLRRLGIAVSERL